MLIPSWVGEYVGVPFVPQGRTVLGCDCYGLVRLVLLEQFNVEWPLFSDDYSIGDVQTEERLIDEHLSLLCAEQETAPTYGSVVLLRYCGRVTHMGLYLGSNALLHTERKLDSHVVRLSDMSVSSRIAGYYRVDKSR